MKDVEYRSTKLSQLSHVTIEQAADGIFWLDSEGRIHRVNDAACRLLGYSREELLAMTVPDFDPSIRSRTIKSGIGEKSGSLGQ